METARFCSPAGPSGSDILVAHDGNPAAEAPAVRLLSAELGRLVLCANPQLALSRHLIMAALRWASMSASQPPENIVSGFLHWKKVPGRRG